MCGVGQDLRNILESHPASRPGAADASLAQIQRGLDTPGFLEVFPRAGSKQPKLLQKLELMLAEKLQAAERLVSPNAAGQRYAQGAAHLRLDAHRQVFEAFIQVGGPRPQRHRWLGVQ